MKAWFFTLLLFVSIPAKTWQVSVQNGSTAIQSPLLSAGSPVQAHPKDSLMLAVYSNGQWSYVSVLYYSIDTGKTWIPFANLYSGVSQYSYSIIDSISSKNICFKAVGGDGHSIGYDFTGYSYSISVVPLSTSILIRPLISKPNPFFFVDPLGRINIHFANTKSRGRVGTRGPSRALFPVTP